MTLEELSRAIAEGTYSCSELTMEALQRIAANDQDGKCLNTVAALNTQALMQARVIDEEIQRYGRRSPLHGIPVLVKDNIDCTGFPTTAGSLALADNYPRNDAEIVRRLKDAGALILEKENIDILLSAGDGPKGNLAPISGDPCMILPAVIPDPSDYKPCSWHLTAGPFQEDILLRIAYILEQGAAIMPKPDWCEEFEA